MADRNYSVDSMRGFLDMVGEKGLVKRNTAVSWKTAANKVLDDLTPAEKADVRKVDLNTAFTKFENRNGEKYSPASLGQYRARVVTAVGEFLKWVESPAAYKPRSSSRGADDDAAENGKQKRRQQKTSAGARSTASLSHASTASSPTPAPLSTSGLSFAFPIRSDFLAQVVVPRDINVDEARRLGAFILTLAADFKPASS
jgi:hypothetical protein